MRIFDRANCGIASHSRPSATARRAELHRECRKGTERRGAEENDNVSSTVHLPEMLL